MTVRRREEGKRTHKSNDSWHVEYPSSGRKRGGDFFLLSVACACTRVCLLCVFNCAKCNKSLSVFFFFLNRRTVVLRCPEGLRHEQC